MTREREVFRIQVQDKWVSAWLYSFLSNSRPWQNEKGGWNIMRRLIVLCAIFLSVLSFPGKATAIIIGEVWNTGALSSAANPALGPPTVMINGQEVVTPPAATFTVNGDINFSGNTSSLTFGQFLNSPLDWKSSSIDLDNRMFSKTSTVPDQGIFFRFTWSMVLQSGLLPVTITHDDGFYLFLSDGQTINESNPVGAEPPPPAVSKFDLVVPGTGERTFNLYYGALNDSDDHVLIFSTPEPGSMILLALGIIGVGVLRRRH
jgi:hypothetical protein